MLIETPHLGRRRFVVGGLAAAAAAGFLIQALIILASPVCRLALQPEMQTSGD